MYTKYTEEMLRDAVSKNLSWAAVCRCLNIKPATGSQTSLQRRAKRLEIDTSHFLGKAHNRGKKFGPKRPIQDYLESGIPIKSHQLKLRLIEEGIKKDRCERCNLNEWMGDELPLELDHINGDHDDNHLENLQILCPNCHAIKTRKDGGFSNSLEKIRLRKIRTRKGEKRHVPTGIRPTKINWPPTEELIARLRAGSCSQVARELGVSDNAINRHMRTNGYPDWSMRSLK